MRERVEAASARSSLGAESLVPGEGEGPSFVVERSRSIRAIAGESAKPIKGADRKAGLLAQVEYLRKAVDLEIAQAKVEFYVVLASTIITIAFTVAAKLWSDVSGVLTTFIAGGSGTGIIGATSGSFVSYFGLKTDFKQGILKVEGLLAREPPDFEAAEEIIKSLNDKLGVMKPS